MLNRLLFFASLFLSLICSTRTSRADVGVWSTNQPATGIWVQPQYVTQGTAVNVKTLNLSLNGDTVIHVQKYPEGTHIAGNDDDPACYPCLSSQVSFTPTFTGQVWVVVRAFSDQSYGTATLRTTVSGSSTDAFIGFGGRRKNLSESMTSGKTYTVREAGGATDTVLLAIRAADYAVAFDDDAGFGYMSYFDNPATCSPTCSLIVGTWHGGPNTVEYTTLVADELTSDVDGDTLGGALEATIGTSSTDYDSDDDGLLDPFEVRGYGEWDNVAPNVDLPAYGAHPTQKDIFFEADFLGTASNMLDHWTALDAAGLYAQAGISAHFDTGEWNNDPATRTIYGAWGGASQEFTNAHCVGFTSSRVNLFHHMLITGDPTSGGGSFDYAPYACYSGGQNLWTVMHETGHYRLQHSGVVPGNGGMDCNPFYRSAMNQAHLNDWFSSGLSPGTANPSSILESGWQTLPFLADLQWSPWNYKVDTISGKVDWNRDGVFDTNPVRATPTWVAALDASWPDDCDPSGFSRENFQGAANAPDSAVRNATLAWVHAEGSGRLFMLGRNLSNSLPRFASTTSAALSACDSQPARWTPCAEWGSFQDVTNSIPAWHAPVAVDLGSGQVLLVYVEAYSAKLVYQLGTVAMSTGNVSWFSPQYVSITETYGDDLAATYDGTLVHLYASGNRLDEWIYDPGSQQWTGPMQQFWANVPGSNGIEPSLGVAVVQGATAQDPNASTFALIPGVWGKLQFARKLVNGEWFRYDSFFPLGGPELLDAPLTWDTPGLAYADGRFYLAFTDEQGLLRIGFSEGNDESGAANERRLQVRPYPTFAINQWAGVQENVSLASHENDSHIRLGATTACDDVESCPVEATATVFMPLADGVVDSVLTDHDDYANLTAALDCSLYACCDAPSACPQWMQ